MEGDPGRQFLFVAVLEGGVWTWIDVGSPRVNTDEVRLSASSFRDANGRLLACALIGRTIGTVNMVIGAGRDWRWVDLDRPRQDRVIRAAVVAHKASEPRPGDEPIVVARSEDRIWTRSLTGGWTDLGPIPQDVQLEPTAACEVAVTNGQKALRTVALSFSDSQDGQPTNRSGLWIMDSDGSGVRWENHHRPDSVVVSVIGGYSLPRMVSGGPAMFLVAVLAVDEFGGLWHYQVHRDVGSDFGGGVWTFHGCPTAGAVRDVGVGVFALRSSGPPLAAWVFVSAEDGHLWARTSDPNGSWSWIDHCAPPGTLLRSGVSPIALNPSSGAPAVHVLADDGQLWRLAKGVAGWQWSRRGAPPGQLIFAVIGAAALPSATGVLALAVVVAISGDGALWINVAGGDQSSVWTTLGTPAPWRASPRESVWR